VVGNHGNEKGLDNTTFQYVSKFWDLIDETLNAILFVLIGLELLVINFIPLYLLIGVIAIVIVLCTRYISLFLPAQLINLKEKITQRTFFILTWGGLRGGISIALALSIKSEFEKDLWVSLTYVIVAFAILFQGLTIGKLAKRLKK
jgi:CPA1 family monovalent cation:H+ antiporter